jgi:histidine ammonia-lyase
VTLSPTDAAALELSMLLKTGASNVNNPASVPAIELTIAASLCPVPDGFFGVQDSVVAEFQEVVAQSLGPICAEGV